MYKNAPTRNEFCVIQFMGENPDSYYNIDDLNREFKGILWSNDITPYRILKSMYNKGFIKYYGISNKANYVLTDLGNYLCVIKWQ